MRIKSELYRKAKITCHITDVVQYLEVRKCGDIMKVLHKNEGGDIYTCSEYPINKMNDDTGHYVWEDHFNSFIGMSFFDNNDKVERVFDIRFDIGE